MISTRERLTLGELLLGALPALRANLDDRLRSFVPLRDRQHIYVSQGKAAFEQIVLSARLAGSRVLVPAFFPDDFVGVFLKYRLTPVFVDVNPDSYHLDLGAIRREQLDGARALLIEHTFGLPADGRAFRGFCDRHGLLLIEDCARALGAESAGRLVGSFGHYAMFSLPKCAPVRAGGLALAETPFDPALQPAALGLTGLLHALTLIRYPAVSVLESAIYRVVADSALYPLEVGNYDPLPCRQLDGLARFMLSVFLPHYGAALDRKRQWAQELRRTLEPHGFVFQADPHGEHIWTSVTVDPPAACDADALKAFLIANGVKASAMWRSPWGISPFGRRQWNADPDATPIAQRLATRLIQLPVSRFRTPAQSRRIVELCRRFTADQPSGVLPGRSLAVEH